MQKVIGILSFLFLLCLPGGAQTQQTIRVNAGGPAYIDTKGQLWSADYGFNTGNLSTSAPTATVIGTSDPTLFKSARWDAPAAPELQYQFAVTNGSYQVNLYFAETSLTSVGSRVFDVQMQGATVFSGLDIFAAAGAKHALVKSAQVSVTQGQIVIRFVHHANNPVISAFEILPSGTSTAPSITAQPTSQLVSTGQAATFMVAAMGTSPLSYQWHMNDAAINGATASTYTTPTNTLVNNGAAFRAVVSNAAGNATSKSAILTVISGPVAPTVTSQPSNQTVTAGQTATFAVAASGTAPLSYQWRRDGVNISGARSASYTTPATTSADNGAIFDVVVYNSVGHVTSAATLTVNSAAVAPTITTQPTNQTVTAGQAATFSVVASGTAPLSYQWQKNGAAISGATSASYTTPATASSDNGSFFDVTVSNSIGSVTSNSARLTVNNTGGSTVTVNWTTVHQQIDGFGASSAFSGDGVTNSQADLFWSTTNGIGLSLLRVQIQADGTYPDVATMQKAQARGVTIWGTPWSPPASMKTNGNIDNGGSLLASDFQAYADYLSNYVLTLKNSHGINLYALSVQNEPDFTATYASCIWTGQQFHDFILNNLGPTLAANNAGVKIIMPEQSHWNFNLATATLDDASAAADVSIIASHGYFNNAASYPLGQGQGKRLWETEDATFDAFDGSMANGLTWAQRVNDWMTIANANAWHYWWLVESGSDNEALLGPSGQTTKRLYAVGNYSKFVRPGWVRIDATPSPASGVSVSAYKDPTTGSYAIVVINHNTSSVSVNFDLSGFTANTVTTWETSATLDLAQQASISVGGGSSFSATLDPLSVTTFVGP